MAWGGSITRWIGDLRACDPAAAQRLWEAYFAKPVPTARVRLRGADHRAADQEDVALSSFDKFCCAAGRSRLPQLEDRDDFGQLLLSSPRARRSTWPNTRGGPSEDGGRVLALLDLEGTGPVGVLDAEPSPEMAVRVVEPFQRLLDRLGNETLRPVAMW